MRLIVYKAPPWTEQIYEVSASASGPQDITWTECHGEGQYLPASALHIPSRPLPGELAPVSFTCGLTPDSQLCRGVRHKI